MRALPGLRPQLLLRDPATGHRPVWGLSMRRPILGLLFLLVACQDPSSTTSAATPSKLRWCFDRRGGTNGRGDGFRQRYCPTDEEVGHRADVADPSRYTCEVRRQDVAMWGTVVSQCYQGEYPPGMSPPL